MKIKNCQLEIINIMYGGWRTLSPFLKAMSKNLGLSSGHCRHSPTCSLYARKAIHQHGLLIGGWLAVKRLLKCHPWSSGGYHPVP